MSQFKLTVTIDGNFTHTKVIESIEPREKILRDFMVSVVSEHKLDHPSEATFDFNISELNSFRRHLQKT